MKSEFDEAVSEHNPLYKEGLSHDQFYKGASWAWQHQQSKVDELQKQLIDQGQRFNEQSQRVKDLEHKNVELQKRVDDVIQKSKEFIQFSKNNADIFEDEYEAGKAYGAEAVIELLEQALKGGEE